MATLREVAARAGVSVSTVSRVVRADPTLVIRPETRRRVLDAAEAVRYRPNLNAAALRTRRSKTIALFLPEPQNPGWAPMIAAIQEAAALADYLVAVADVRGAAIDPDVFARYALESRVDGVLLATGLLDDELVAVLADRGLPLLPVGSRYQRVDASVTMADAAGSKLGVDHLVALGHRNIAFVGGFSETDIIIRREAGYRDAMRCHQLDIDERWIVGGPAEVDGESWSRGAAPRLLELPPDVRPTGVITANLVMALGLRTAAANARLRVPGDLSVVTFDDHPIERHLDPPLTAIDMPMAALGTTAMTMLLGAIEGESMRHVVLPDEPRLVLRASTLAPGRPGYGRLP